MKSAIKLPIEDTNIEVRVGSDGVWLHFTANGRQCAIHAWNVLGDGSRGISASTIHDWCLERQGQALKIIEDHQPRDTGGR
jgi:hypothetical protein